MQSSSILRGLESGRRIRIAAPAGSIPLHQKRRAPDCARNAGDLPGFFIVGPAAVAGSFHERKESALA
jgi:hypothetical protein